MLRFSEFVTKNPYYLAQIKGEKRYNVIKVKISNFWNKFLQGSPLLCHIIILNALKCSLKLFDLGKFIISVRGGHCDYPLRASKKKELHRWTYWCLVVDSSWNVMAHGDAQEGKWRGNWWMEWVASTHHTTSEYGVSSITTADAHTLVASIRLNWRPPADLNGLVSFAERRNLVSARVPSHFNWPLRQSSSQCGPHCPQHADLAELQGATSTCTHPGGVFSAFDYIK